MEFNAKYEKGQLVFFITEIREDEIHNGLVEIGGLGIVNDIKQEGENIIYSIKSLMGNKEIPHEVELEEKQVFKTLKEQDDYFSAFIQQTMNEC